MQYWIADKLGRHGLHPQASVYKCQMFLELLHLLGKFNFALQFNKKNWNGWNIFSKLKYSWIYGTTSNKYTYLKSWSLTKKLKFCEWVILWLLNVFLTYKEIQPFIDFFWNPRFNLRDFSMRYNNWYKEFFLILHSLCFPIPLCVWWSGGGHVYAQSPISSLKIETWIYYQ